MLSKNFLHEGFHILIFGKSFSQGRQMAYTLFQIRNQLMARIRHGLQEQPPCAGDRTLRVEFNTQIKCRRNLLGLQIIIGKVQGDVAVFKADFPGKGLFGVFNVFGDFQEACPEKGR